MGGMMISLTSELTILPKAAPMITPMARSSTLPRMANSLNSSNIFCILCSFVWVRGAKPGTPASFSFYALKPYLYRAV